MDLGLPNDITAPGAAIPYASCCSNIVGATATCMGLTEPSGDPSSAPLFAVIGPLKVRPFWAST